MHSVLGGVFSQNKGIFGPIFDPLKIYRYHCHSSALSRWLDALVMVNGAGLSPAGSGAGKPSKIGHRRGHAARLPDATRAPEQMVWGDGGGNE